MKVAAPKLEIDQELVDRANDFQQIVSDSRWKRLLDELARFNDAILGEIRCLPVHERDKTLELAIMWKHHENYLTLVQNIVLGTLEQRNQYVREILRGKLPEEKIEDLIRSSYA